MTIRKLLKKLGENAVELHRRGDNLVVKGGRQALDPLVVNELKRYKAQLLKLVIESPDGVYSPAEITPQMLSLVDLQQEQIDRIVEQVSGGARNVQDIYPLIALQEGILFHHLMNEQGDPYLVPVLLAFDTRERLDRFTDALQRVIDRHDILRTGVLWEELPQPVQVVWRRAVLPVEEVPLEGADRAQQLRERFDSQRYRIDVRQAPLLRAFVAQEESLEGSPGSSPGRWLLLLLSHHLAIDHATLEIAFEEVQAYLRGEQDRLGAPVAFREFVAQARLGVSAAEHEEFFRGMLGDVEEPTAPFGLLDVRGDGSEIGEARLGLEEGLWDRLRKQARLLGVSAASVCHLAWAQVLARLTGREEVVFGTVLFGRMQGGEGVERALGLFINTLPIRLSVSGQGVRDSVRQVHERLGRLFCHEHASLALAQRCSGVPASLPLFTTTLNYRHNPAERDLQAQAGIQLLPTQERSNYPLTVSVDDLGDSLRLRVRVSGGIEPRRICEWIHTALAGLVEALERAPQRAIRTIDVLPAAERAQVLQAFNATAVPYPQDRLIHELFEEQVERTPGAMAVICGDAQLTYEQLNRRANQLAHYLIKRGVGADQLVGLCLGPSVELIVGMLGVLKAGGAYVPLEPSQPAERLGSMLEDCAASWVLTSERIEPLLPAGSAQAVVLDRDWNVMEREESDNPACRDQGVGAQHLAYVMYTSGSTGQPKGVMVEHGNLVNYTHQAVQRFDVARGTGSLIGTSLGFDLALTGLYPPLVCGKPVRLCVDTQDLQGLSAALLSCRDLAPVKLTPSHLTALLSLLPPQQLQGCVRVLVLGGEALTAGSIQQWWQADAGTRIFNHYGPTETTIGCVMNELDRTQSGSIPIGRPIANARIYILDERREPVPIGGVGEIYIGGAGVARGYLNRPELTAERFVKDPFQARKTHGPADPQARMYRSGDLGRWRADGKIEYLGRNDQQVKIRGYRIELGEIEAQLRKHAQVREAVVLARDDVPGQKRLVAYLTYRGAEAPSIESVREHLKGSLPEQMLPGAYVVLDSLPLTANGKLDRRALPAPAGSGLGEREYEPLQGEIEEALGSIWQEVLQVERVGRQNNFFELGGHSLLAVQVITRIRQVLGRELPVRVLFDAPTVQGLARQLSSALQAEVRPMSRADRTQALPLSWAQQRLWFIDQLEGGGAAYHIPAAVGLNGVLDAEALQGALDTLLERHEVLRTVFRNVDGQPVQVITETTRFALQVLDLSALKADEREQAVNEQAAQEARAPFDLSTGPLIRGRLLKLEDEEHILLVTMHHIASDGWSTGVLIREVGALYAAYREGRANPLPPLPIQYADYAVWQRQWLQGEVLSGQLGYWKQQLSEAPALLELPTDRPRPGVQSYRGASVPIVLDRELSRQIGSLARRHDATLFMALYAGFAILLSRLSGQQDIVVGTAVANRQRVEIEGLIGFFVNTLALRIRLEDEWTIAEVLERVKALTLEGYAHQDVPFEHVVEALQPQRTLSHSPLFQAMLTLQNTPRSELQLPGLTLQAQGTSLDTEKFDLTLSLQEGDEEIHGSLGYASDLFDRATIERWAGCFEAVLTAMVQDERQPLGAVSLLDERTRRQVLEEFNATAVPYPQDRLVHELFEAQVQRTPQAIAVVCGEERLTYEELNARANRLAHYLRERGVRVGEHVVLLLKRSVELIVAELAVLKCGAVYVPLDTEWPQERQRFVVQDCQGRMLISDPGVSGWTLEGVERIEIGEVLSREEMTDEGVCHNLAVEQEAQASAYVMYTSGSTGEPKGVIVPHRAVARLVLNNGYARFGTDDRIAFAANPAFDAATLEVWAPLLNGGRIVVIAQEKLLEPREFAAALHAAAVNVLWLTVGLFNHYSEVLMEHFSRLRYLIVGGDRLDPRVVRDVLRRGAPEHLLNGYGPTETTTFASTYEVTEVPEGVASIPIGRPIANTRIYILDGYGQPMPIGVSGEIYIGGAGVARGYLNRPELTAERFVNDPFQTHPQARMYRTGDMGRWRADGTIEYLGRNDGQVKIRGYRIELGEIEAQLLKCEGVAAAVVLAQPEVSGEKRLVAYYTVKGEEPAIERLRGQLESKLPQYMVPSAYVRLESMPLTPNGKLDRRALQAPAEEAYGQRGYEAPEGELESTLARLWQEVLRVERVGRHDNFFELGGHSLSAVQVITRVRQGLSRELAVRVLFESPTVQGIARQLSSALPAEVRPMSRADRARALPLSWAQQRLWFIDQLEGGGAAYHIPVAVRMRGVLEPEALQAALDTLLERHEVLRAVFRKVDGQPVQVITETKRFALRVLDLSARAAEEREQEVAEQTRQEASVRFELSTGPLIRARLLKLEDDEHILLVTMHHIVSDGWSTGVLIREVVALYAAYREGRANPLPPLPIQYADYALWQRQWLQGELLSGQLEYWKQQLSGAPALLELPTDRPRPGIQSHRGARVPVLLDRELSRQIGALARRHDATLFMVLYAGFAILLSRLSGQQDVVAATSVANRQRMEIEGLIGFFVNTLPLRVQLEDGLTIAEVLKRVKELTLEGYAHQDVPFEQVVEAVQPPRTLSHSPVFQVVLTWLNAPHSELKLPGLALEAQGTPSNTEKLDLTLVLQEEEGQVRGSLSYATDLFDRVTIERWIRHFQGVLTAMVEDDRQPLGAVSLLDEGARRQVLEEFNATEMPYPRDRLIHELFQEQVQRTPKAIALVCGEERLTYEELNRRANQLAHSLLGRGVKAEDLVAICLERSAAMIIGLLGVLKAGAAYVPLDPSYPAERLMYMVEDAAPVILLTQARLISELPVMAVQLIALDAHHPPAGEQAVENPDASALGLSPRNLAYVIYTSGSTGQPKGVMVEHGGLCNLAMEQARTLDIEADSRVLQCASFSFDACAFEIVMALCNGAGLYLPEAEAVLAGPTLTRALAQHHITHATLTPAVLAALHEDATLNGVRTLVVAGDACTPELVKRWAPERLFINAYGPTEATIWSTFQQCDAHLAAAPPIGRPIANTRIYILDGYGRPVPIGVSGEIYIGGVGIARGYLNRPELTAERFVKDPFQARKTHGPADPQARMYRTGDLGRWKADGTIEYLGRNDNQLKIRGYRIELGEIEAQLLNCEGVGAAVVLGRESVSGEKRLVAYYTVKGEEPAIERLRGQLESKLPQYMVPAAYVRLESMPLTPNGKLDRKALPTPEGEAFGKRVYEAPQGELESTLAELWQEVLQVERVGRQDNFFELGGHSLLAVTLIERMRQRGLTADVRSLFTVGTLTEFARHLNHRDVRIDVPDNPLRDLHEKIDSVSSNDLIELKV